ncbi:uncharacterized protein KY384_008012 [Bacidia gigantensis]|uniref:uncharacterized protein n=1 Tax=Bacidia gigantensis TaxID=2732470 RepID=UPI001D042BE7|nr:uncharacterized protein KY384_008012 [Bacidia gigantensis]KAG8527268.1 hypothetical protein KY384_008012 [Bacidia gigantensis]
MASIDDEKEGWLDALGALLTSGVLSTLQTLPSNALGPEERANLRQLSNFFPPPSNKTHDQKHLPKAVDDVSERLQGAGLSKRKRHETSDEGEEDEEGEEEEDEENEEEEDDHAYTGGPRRPRHKTLKHTPMETPSTPSCQSGGKRGRPTGRKTPSPRPSNSIEHQIATMVAASKAQTQTPWIKPSQKRTKPGVQSAI